MSAFHRFLSFYQTCVSRAPYLTNCTLGFVIAGIGDVICQKYFESNSSSSSTSSSSSSSSTRTNQNQLKSLKYKVDESLPQTRNDLDIKSNKNESIPIQDEVFVWNKERSVKMGLIRAFVITPFVMFWYPFVTAIAPGQTLFLVLRRVFVDQCTGAPICIILVFLANALLNNDLKNVSLQLQQQLYITWLTGLKYWPFVHMITFGVIPPPIQPLFAHFASVYWNAVLSFYSNKKVQLPSISTSQSTNSLSSRSSSPLIRSTDSNDSEVSRKSA